MSSIFRLKKHAMESLRSAVDGLNSLPSSLANNGRDRAVGMLMSVISELEEIDLDNYLLLRKNGASTQAYFDDPIRRCIEALGSPYAINVPYDLERIRDRQSEKPDIGVLRTLLVIRKDVRSAYRDFRQLQSTLLRTLMSGWLVALIFVIAVLYAIGYFVFFRSGVSHPLSHAGAVEIAQSIRQRTESVSAGMHMASDVLDASNILIKGLIDLVSKIPPLLAAAAAVYAAVRKLFIK